MTKFAKHLPALWLTLWFAAAALAWFQNNPSTHDLSRALQPGSGLHVLGFDSFGRDLLMISLQASAVSSLFALAAAFICAFGGLAVGSFMAIAPEKTRFWFQRFLELLLAFPSLLLALAWAAIRGPGWDTLVVSLLIGILPSFSRLIFSRAREVMNEDFIHAARAFGSGSAGIFFRHLVPSLSSLCVLKLPGIFAHALLAEATLSFLGVGAPIGRDTWGSLLAQGRDYLLEAPHIAFGTGVPLVLTVLALQFHPWFVGMENSHVTHRKRKKTAG